MTAPSLPSTSLDLKDVVRGGAALGADPGIVLEKGDVIAFGYFAMVLSR